MRTFINAKAVASTIREELAARGVELSHSDSLEIAAKAFGSADWNTLSAKIKQGATEDQSVSEEGRELSWPEVALPFYKRHLSPEEKGGRWAILFLQAQELYAARADASSEKVLDLAHRWLRLSDAVNGGNTELRNKHAAAYREALADPHVAPKLPLSRDLLAWFSPALADAASAKAAGS